FTAQALRKVERAGPSYIFLENLIQFLVEVGVILVALKCFIQLLQDLLQFRRHKTASEFPEKSFVQLSSCLAHLHSTPILVCFSVIQEGHFEHWCPLPVAYWGRWRDWRVFFMSRVKGTLRCF